MKRRRFIALLILISLGLLLFISILRWLPAFSTTYVFSLISLGVFVVLSIILYFFGVHAAVSKDKNAFSRLVMSFTIIKIVLVLVLIVAYKKIAQPADLFFLIPFFAIYLTFTVFETAFMTQLGKIKSR